MNTKNFITQTAFRLFIDKGFTDVSVNEIIAEAGLTKGGFYHHFKSKDELIFDVFEKYMYQYFTNIIEEIESSGLTALAKLQTLFERITCYDEFIKMSLQAEHVDFEKFYLLTMEGMKKYNYILKFRKEVNKGFQKIITEALEEGKKLGEVKQEIDAEEAAMKMIAYSEGAVMLKILDSSVQLKKAVKESLNAV